MIAFISDIHGNKAALDAVLADARAAGAERFFCLGDVIGYGPEPRECLEAVIEVCELCLLGNHEQGAMFYAPDFNPRARAAIEWTRDRLNDRERTREENFRLWNYISAMPERHVEGDLLLVHGSPRDPVREYVLPGDALDAEKMRGCFERMGEARLCFVGHSHVPGVYEEGGGYQPPGDFPAGYARSERRALINIGSVGQPRDGDVRASYVLFDGERVLFRRVAYDVEETIRKIRATSLPASLAERLAVGR